MTPDARTLVTEACARWNIADQEIEPLGGATASVFATSRGVVKVGAPDEIDRETLAIGAARTTVPVPSVLERLDRGSSSALLMSLLPGEAAWSPARHDPRRARRRGRACGEIQRRIGAIVAPRGLPSLDTGDRLLHLDLHPLNILIDDDDQVTGVIDWAKAAAGSPERDRARTASILHRDPAARAVSHDPSWIAFVEGWTEAAALDDVTADARRWADRFLEHDLARRAGTPPQPPLRSTD